MDLQRCHSCKSMIATETVLCPICGRNPAHRPLGRKLLLTTAILLTVLIAARFRPHFTHPTAPAPTASGL